MKEDKDLALRRLEGKKFQIEGAAYEKERQPRAVFAIGLIKRSLKEERRYLEGL